MWDLSDESMTDIIKENWQDPYGDRRQELVFIGTGIDKDDINQRLEKCLLTDQEFNLGEDVWATYLIQFTLGNLQKKFQLNTN